MQFDETDALAVINREVNSRLNEGDSSEMAYARYMIDFLEEIGLFRNGQDAYVKKSSHSFSFKINAFGASDDGKEINLLAVLYDGSTETKSIDQTRINKCVDGVIGYIDFVSTGLFSDLIEGSREREVSFVLNELLANCLKIRIIISTDMIIPKKVKRRIIEKFGKEVVVDVFGLGEHTTALNAVDPPLPIEKDFTQEGGLRCLSMPDVDEEIKVYSAIIPGKVLADLYLEHGQRLLEMNVRSFLRSTTSTNKGIRKTLKDNPERFMAYNNGIVITASEADIQRDANSTVINKLKGIQIVNGGQTTASLHFAMTNDKLDISKAFVQAKIVVLAPEQMDDHVQKISRWANTQNSIKQADLGSNDPFHRHLHTLSRMVLPADRQKWYYERTNGQYMVELTMQQSKGVSTGRTFEGEFPTNRRFSKLHMASTSALWDQLPHEASRGGQACYQLWAKRQEINPIIPDDAFFKNWIAKWIVVKATQRIVKEEKFVAYRANIVNYVVSLLAKFDHFQLSRVWNAQVISPELESVIREMAHRVDRRIREIAGVENVTQICKRVRMWEELKDSVMMPPISTVPELQPIEIGS